MRSLIVLSSAIAFASNLSYVAAAPAEANPFFSVAGHRFTAAGLDAKGHLQLRGVIDPADIRGYVNGQAIGKNGQVLSAETLTLGSSVVVELAAGGDANAIGKALGAKSRQNVAGLARFVRFDLASPEAALAFVNNAHRIAGVRSIEPEIIRQHISRDVPNDARFSNQQHLLNTGQSSGSVGSDANVTPWWNFAGNTRLGAGVNIAIVDDGLRHTHEDIAPNYRPALSYDFNGGDSDPMNTAGVDNHGTSCAGVAAARGNNGVGGSGAAPRAGLAGIRLTAAGVSSSTTASALSFQSNNQGNLGTNHIYSNSWGPSDNGSVLGTIGTVTTAAFQNNATSGRGGLGSIYVWAGGNGGNADNSNYDAYANNRNIIAVAALGNNNVRASYSERGSNIFVTAPSNGGTRGIDTVDGDADNDYTTSFGGTSSATPLVSGVIALMLEANPNLSARDVKHILARTSTVVDDTASGGWQANSAGRRHSEKYGFGRINAHAAATMALTWQNVGPQLSASKSSGAVNVAIPDGTGNASYTSETNNTFGAAVTSSINFTDLLRIETVEVTVNATHSYRGDLEFVLTGPSGLKSVLGTIRNDGGDNLVDWTFSSVRYWDELSTGNWTLSVRDGYATDTGTFNNWSLSIYGTAVPEPTIIGLFGIAATLVMRRRRHATLAA